MLILSYNLIQEADESKCIRGYPLSILDRASYEDRKIKKEKEED